MMNRRRTGWTLLIAANVLCYCVLGYYQTTEAMQRKPSAPPPFANSVQQRNEMITLLRDVRGLLKEQNALLRSGEVKVVVVQPEKR
ncbi:MAG: hypothetical protein JXB62_23575 [Pirellulales bacterium]|nr:hypothetical protein [Pirellulales bacterium]